MNRDKAVNAKDPIWNQWSNAPRGQGLEYGVRIFDVFLSRTLDM